MELSELIFTAKTDDLERVSKVIGGLVVEVGKLDKATMDAAKTEATLAKAARDNAKASLDAAKTEALKRREVEGTTRAQRQATTTTEKHTSILQRQADIYDFLAQGYSKGQAGILATAKATGQYSKELEEILKLQKQFTADPFDRSDMALNRMIRSLKELKDAQSFTNQGMNLTTKQARELSNDLARLEASLKRQGKSYDEISKAQALHKQQFVEEAAALNRSQSAMDAVEKQRKEVVTATNYLTQADAKMAAALNQSNAAIDKAGTDSLVRYENALRKSGVSQEVATQKLAKYRVQLEQVQKQELARREQHLTRALAPQATDVVVSLWSGQNPLTVLLQQGGQVTDLFMQSGIAAEKFGEVVKKSMASMLPSILTVVKGVGGLLVDGFVAAGKAVSGFLATSIGITGTLDKLYMKLSEDGPSKWGGVIRGLSSFLTGVFATGVAAVTAGLIALAVAFKQAVAENNLLAKSLALSGGSLALSHDSALEYVKSLGSVGVTSSKATEAMAAMAKEGNFASSEILLVGKAASDMAKWADVAIADTVKSFSKLKEKPSEALTEIAQKTGMVSLETLKMVQELEKQGKTAEAAALAMESYASVTEAQTSKMKDNYNSLTTTIIELGSSIGEYFSKAFKSIFMAPQLEDLQEKLQKTTDLLESGNSLPTFGSIFGGKSATQELEAQKRALQDQIDQIMLKSAAEEHSLKVNSENAKNHAATSKVMQDVNQLIDKASAKTLTLSEYTAKYVADKQKLGKFTSEEIAALEKAAKIEWERDQKKPKKDPSENYYATLMREATNNTIAANTATQELTKSEQKLLEVKADPRFAKLTTTQQADVIAKYDAAIAAERQTAMTEKLAEAEEHRLKLLGKSEGIGKQYYADMQKLEEFAKVANWSREEIEELTRAVFQQTPAWKAYEKALEDVNTASRKFQEDSLASQASVLQENRSLDHRLSLLGKTTEEQKALVIEYNRANKLREVDVKLAKKLREIEEEIAKAKKKGLPESDYKSLIDAEIQARKDAAEQHKAINREVAVQYAEDMQREIDAIKSGISDSIVTALFEGGKAGSKKLRNLIVDQLKKPVTLVVQAAVNLLLGSLMGSVGLGGLASSALGSAGGSLLGSAAGSAAGGMFGNFLGGGSLTGMIGNITAGVTNGVSTLFSQGIGSVFSQGTGLMAAGSAGGGLGTLLGGIGLPLLGIGALISGLSRKLKDVGIEGSFGGDTGFEGRKYKFYKGGFLRSNKTTYENLDPEIQKDLGNAFLGMKKSVADMANTLGLGTEALEKFKTNIKVSFWNLKDDEIQAKLQEALATANNELAEQVIGTWETTTSTVSRQIQSTFMEMEAGAEAYRTVEETITASTYVASEYAREGEKAIDTLTRLATSLSTVNSVFENLGVTLFQSSLAGADLASALVDAFGGIEAFISATSYFYDNFYSDTEKFVNQQRQLTSVFNQFGVALPQSKEEFRKLLESIDLTTDSGREMYAALMKIAPGFVQFIELTGQLGTTIDDSTEAARRAAEEARQNALSNLDKALSNLRSAINAEKSSINEDLNAAKQVHSKIKSVFDTLSKAIENLYQQATDPVMAAEQGNAFISAALKAAQASGALPDNEELQKAIAAATGGFGIENYSSLAERRYAQLKLAGELEKLKTLTGDQLSDSEYQIKLLEDQLEILDDTLKYWEQQVEAAKGGIEAVMSVESAIVAMQVALQTVLEEGFGAIVEGGLGGSSLLKLLEELAKQYSPNTPKEALEQLVKSISEGVITKGQGLNLLTGTPTKSGAYRQNVDIEGISELDFYQGIRTNTDTLIAAGWTADALAKAMIAGGVSLTDMAKAYGITAAEVAANLLKNGATVLPQLAVGTNYLPDDMVIQAHKGERIIPKADNEQLMRYISGGGSSNSTDNSALITEIRALRVQNERLEARLNAIQQNTKVTSDLLDQVTEGGNAMRTSAI